jgi:hypothetical protein
MGMVTVYRWTKYDITTDEQRPSRRMATAEAIALACGVPVEGTAREIDISELEIDGMTARDFHLRSNRTGFQTRVG